MSSYSDAFKITQQYGIQHPLSNFGTPQTAPTDEVTKQIGNYQTRLSAINEPVPTPAHKTNILLQALSMLDRPRAALWNGVHDAVTGEDSLLHGMYTGLTGQDNYTGTELMGDIGVKNKLLKGVLGFGAEMLGDPLTYATLGAGSLAKGFLTGGAKALTEGGAEALARAALKEAEAGTVKAGIKSAAEKAGADYTEAQLNSLTRGDVFNRAQQIASKYDINLDKTVKTMDAKDIYQHAQDLLAKKIQATSVLKTAPTAGISAFGKTLVSGDTLEKAGAAAGNFLKDKVPVLGDKLQGVQDFAGKMFSPKYIQGLDRETTDLMYKFKRDASGAKNVMDAKAKQNFDMMTSLLGSLGKEEAHRQDKLITQVIEGTKDISELHPDVAKLVDQMKNDFEAWGHSESDLGVLKSMFDENYFPHVMNWSPTSKPNRRGGLTESLKIENPSGYFRAHGKTVEDANRTMLYKTSGEDAKRAFIDSLWNHAGKMPPDKEPFAKDIAEFVKEHNIDDATYSAIEKATLNGQKDFFETSAVKGWMTRALRHNQILADKNFIDNTIAAFGERVTDPKVLKQLQNEGRDIVIPKSSITAFALNRGDFYTLSREFKREGKTATLGVDNTFQVPSDFNPADTPLGDAIWRSPTGDQPIKVTDWGGEHNGQHFVQTESGQQIPLEDVVYPGADGAMPADANINRLGKSASDVVKRLIKDTPEAFVTISPEDFQILRDKASALFVHYNPIEAYAMPGGVIAAVNKGAHNQVDAGAKALGGAIDKFMGIWKPSVTGLRPDYHLRNMVGSTLNNLLDIGFKTFDPRIQMGANKIMAGVDGIVHLAGQDIKTSEIREAMARTHANMNMQISEFTNAQKALNRRAEHAMSGKTAVGKTVDLAKHPLKTMADTGEFAGRKIETQVRSVNFLANVENGLERGMSKEQAFQFAGEQVNKFHFDYTELTDVERNVFRRLLPFYGWMRKNMPLQLEQIANQPRAFLALPRYQSNMEQAMGTDSSNMPDWMKQSMAMPLPVMGKDGKPLYANISPPMADLARLGDPLKETINSLSPLAKLPLEAALNISLLTGAPLEQYPGQKSQLVPGVDVNNRYLMNALNQFGIARDVKNAMAGEAGASTTAKAVNTVMPMSGLIRSFDETGAATDALQAYNRQLGNTVQQFKDEHGFAVPGTVDADKWALLDPEVKQLIKDTGVIPPYLKATQMISIPVSEPSNNPVGFRARYLSKIKGKQETFDKALNSVLYKNGGL